MFDIMPTTTNGLFHLQAFCSSHGNKDVVIVGAMNATMPEDPGEAGRWMRSERLARGWSGSELAARINGIAALEGYPSRVSQQVISNFEKGTVKRMPAWVYLAPKTFTAADEETAHDPYLSTGKTDRGIEIRLLPTHVGLGAGGTGEGDEGVITFSRDLIENELRAPPDKLLAMIAEGNSMEPDFKGGDQIIVDTRRTSLAQPGAFCLWDGDGHVIKYLEKVPDTDPVRVRVISANNLYEARERLLDEIGLIGRVIWFGRRVQ